jgi:DNA-binding CsgD family transcriptional regulator
MKITFSSLNYSPVSFSAFDFIKKEVLVDCLKKGMSNREIAAHLSVHERTVWKYIKHYDLKPAIKSKMANMKEMINSPEYAHCTLKEIQEKTGINPTTIIKWKKIYNVPTSREVYHKEVLRMYKSGLSLEDIAEATKTSKHNIWIILLENGFEVKKIQELELQKRIDTMIDYYQKGLDISEMAKEMGVAPSELKISEKKYFGEHVFKQRKK